MIGICLCGEIEFEVRGPIALYQCHCSLCRKQGGSAANAASIVKKSSFSWLKGEDRITCYRKETGFSSDFCSVCGSPVPNRLRDTDLVWIPAGLLEEDENLNILIHIYTKSKASWDTIPASAQHFDEMPDIDTFYRILHPEDEE